MRELLSASRRHDHELQVGALGTAVKDGQLNAEFVPEVSGDVLHHIGLGGRGQAQDRRDRLLPGLLADEAPDVAIIGPEVMAPPREAVGLVQHPHAPISR